MDMNYVPMPDSGARTSSGWVFVARSLAQLSGSEEQALICMKHAQLMAERVSDWLELATAWKIVFSNPDEARRCMSVAESCDEAQHSWESWVELAIAWEQVLGDEEKAQKWSAKIRAFDEESHDITHWIACAKTWKNKLKDRETGLKCLGRAETRAGNCSDWMQLAKVWKVSFRRRRDGLRCIEEAETHAERYWDWIELCRLWKETFQEARRSIECLDNAEKLAEHFSEWIMLVAISMGDFHDSVRGIRCLNAAEAIAKTSSDWVQLAISRMKTFHDRDNAIRSLEQAETVARTASDWGQIGYAWEGSLGDTENGQRCLRIGYGNVNRFEMWGSGMDAFTNWVVDLKAMREGGVASLGVIEKSCSFQGSWSDQIVSQRRPGYRARYYSFRVPETALVGLDFTPRDDTYLYLMSGADANGPVLAENDGPLWGDSNSRIIQILQAGVYSIEATTCSESGPKALMLTIRYRQDLYTYLASLQE